MLLQLVNFCEKKMYFPVGYLTFECVVKFQLYICGFHTLPCCPNLTHSMYHHQQSIYKQTYCNLFTYLYWRHVKIVCLAVIDFHLSKTAPAPRPRANEIIVWKLLKEKKKHEAKRYKIQACKIIQVNKYLNVMNLLETKTKKHQRAH